MSYACIDDPDDFAVESIVGISCTFDECFSEEEGELVIAVACQA